MNAYDPCTWNTHEIAAHVIPQLLEDVVRRRPGTARFTVIFVLWHLLLFGVHLASFWCAFTFTWGLILRPFGGCQGMSMAVCFMLEIAKLFGLRHARGLSYYITGMTHLLILAEAANSLNFWPSSIALLLIATGCKEHRQLLFPATVIALAFFVDRPWFSTMATALNTIFFMHAYRDWLLSRICGYLAQMLTLVGSMPRYIRLMETVWLTQNPASMQHVVLHGFAIMSSYLDVGRTHAVEPVQAIPLSSIPGFQSAQNSTICVICQDMCVSNALMVQLECEHVFHESCFTPWRTLNKRCPLCGRERNIHSRCLRESPPPRTSPSDPTTGSTTALPSSDFATNLSSRGERFCC